MMRRWDDVGCVVQSSDDRFEFFDGCFGFSRRYYSTKIGYPCDELVKTSSKREVLCEPGFLDYNSSVRERELVAKATRQDRYH